MDPVAATEDVDGAAQSDRGCIVLAREQAAHPMHRRAADYDHVGR